MADGRRRDAWSRASELMSLLANCHRDPKKHRPFTAYDFDPYGDSRQRRAKLPKVGIEILKDVFINRKPQDARRSV